MKQVDVKKRGVNLEKLKTALVLEGGAMRGMYTAGVLDVFEKAGLEFDGIIGVSAGALFGVNYLSKQPGRVIRYNKRFNRDRNYMGLLPLLKTGNIIDTKYAYERVPRKLDPFDNVTYKKSKVPFYAVVTNVETGRAEYIRVKDVFKQMDVLRASGSMPFVSLPVKIGDNLYLDGAIADSIPYEHMLKLGYDRLVVVLTKDPGYVKKPINKLLVALKYRRRFPAFARAVADRHIMYNDEMDRLNRLEKAGVATVLRPSRKVKIKKTETDPAKLQALYNVGVADGKNYLKKLRAGMKLETGNKIMTENRITEN